MTDDNEFNIENCIKKVKNFYRDYNPEEPRLLTALDEQRFAMERNGSLREKILLKLVELKTEYERVVKVHKNILKNRKEKFENTEEEFIHIKAILMLQYRIEFIDYFLSGCLYWFGQALEDSKNNKL